MKKVYVSKLDCWIFIDENSNEEEKIKEFIKKVKNQRKFMCRTVDKKNRTTSWSEYKKTGKRFKDK